MEFDHSTDTILPDDQAVLTIGGTGGITLPSGTTAQRAGSTGTLRWNTDLAALELLNSSSVWQTPGSLGISQLGRYKSVTNNQAASDPGSGNLKWNNATQSSSTSIYIDALTSGGFDATNYLNAVEVPSVLVIQDMDDASIFQRWTVTSIVDSTGWFTFSVTYIDGAGTFANNKNIAIALMFNGTSGSSTGYLTFTNQSTSPGALTLYTDNGANYQANTMVWDNPAAFLGEVSFGAPGTEQGSIVVNGTTYDAIVKINEFGGTRDASLILHRHATTPTISATLAFARAVGDTSSHSNVASGDTIGEIVYAGWNTSSYYRAARILVEVDGTPGVTDMPGRIRFLLSPDGSATPTEYFRIASTGAFGLSGANYGTTNQVLTSNGPTAAPTWTAPPGATDLSYTAGTRLLASSTGADVTLPLFSSTDAGLTPASGGGTTTYLRADGTWAAQITVSVSAPSSPNLNDLWLSI